MSVTTSASPVLAVGMACDSLRLLAALHAREPDAATLACLRATRFPASLGLRRTTAALREAAQAMQQALARVGAYPTAAELDELAADFAAIYLTHAYAASPCESVWLDEDQVNCQAPMFAVRQWYRRFGLAAPDWRRQPDDHLVLQLQFLAHLLEHAPADSAVDQAIRFMDEHLLRWLGAFAQRVAQRCETAYFAALAKLTWEYVQALRVQLAPA